MDLDKYPFRATFTANARVIAPTEQDRFVAKASLLPLRGLLPADIDPADSPDLLYVAGNGALGGLCNRNGDAISCATAVAINQSAKNKFISADHDRGRILGVVLYPGFTRFGSNEPMTEAEAAAATEPFNMAFVGVLWRVVDPQIGKYISSTVDDPESELSFSWEIMFNRYSIGVGSQNVFDARVIKPEDSSFGVYDKLLLCNKGPGKDDAGQDVFRIIEGDPILLGYSAVARPAAHVKGILPIEKKEEPAAVVPANELSPELAASLENQPESGAGYHLVDLLMQDGTKCENVAVLNRKTLPAQIIAQNVVAVTLCKKSEEKIINPEKTCVTPITTQAMTIKTVDELKAQWGEIRKMETCASVEGLIQAIEDGSKTYLAEVEAHKNAAKAAEEAKNAALAAAEQAARDVASIRAELAEVRAAAEATENAQKFTERMASFDEEYNLDAEDRAVIASDIKDLSDDAFAAYATKAKVLMRGKKKSEAKKDEKPFPPKKEDEEDDECEAKKKAPDAKAALASVTDAGDKKVPNGPTEIDVSLAAQMAAAFGGSLKVDGKPVVQTVQK